MIKRKKSTAGGCLALIRLSDYSEGLSGPVPPASAAGLTEVLCTALSLNRRLAPRSHAAQPQQKPRGSQPKACRPGAVECLETHRHSRITLGPHLFFIDYPPRVQAEPNPLKQLRLVSSALGTPQKLPLPGLWRTNGTFSIDLTGFHLWAVPDVLPRMSVWQGLRES